LRRGEGSVVYLFYKARPEGQRRKREKSNVHRSMRRNEILLGFIYSPHWDTQLNPSLGAQCRETETGPRERETETGPRERDRDRAKRERQRQDQERERQREREFLSMSE
jgi:hypothetical protein